MKRYLRNVFVIITVINFLCNCDGIDENFSSSADSVGKGVQIIKLQDHKFELQKDTLKSILGVNYIKDRYVVVVSVVGAFREGKSFLLNFFLRYLYSMVSNKEKIKNNICKQNDGSNYKILFMNSNSIKSMMLVIGLVKTRIQAN